MKKLLILLSISLMALPCMAQKVGLQLYSLRNEFPSDVPGTFEKIADWGIKYLEDGNDGTYGYPFDDYKAMMIRNGLEMVSISAPFDELKDSPETVLDRAQKYGAKYVVCFWIPHNGNDFTLEDTEKAIKVFNKAGKLLEEHDVLLAYHPHGYEFRPHKSGTLMDHMIKKSAYFDFEMDVYWFAYPGEDPVDWLKKYPQEFKLMHMKDCRKGVQGNQNGHADIETNVVLGTGQIDMDAIVEEVKKMDIEYMFIEDESSRSVEQIPQSLEYLKSLD